MSRFLTIFFVLFCSFIVHAADSLVLVRSIPVKARLFTTDPMGNVFLVKEDNSLIRYSSTGDSTGFFNEVKKGRLTQLDATNPMRILLFFADYGQIVILDHLLSIKSTLRLNTIGLFNVNCIANSADGNIWIFEPASGTLLKIDEEPSVRQSAPLRNLLSENLDPVFMVEQDRTLFMADTLEGIKKFDQYGFYKSSYAFFPKEVQFINQYLVYYQAPYLHSYHTQTLQEKQLRIPTPEDVVQVRAERNKIYVLRRSSVDIYELTAP